ncbi:hypothetical protein ACVU7I_14080 [Patulibacter sp. S7RM1-6]
MGMFFIDTSSGRVATRRQLMVAGLADTVNPPERPWHQIRANVDASTLWYAVLRRQERGIWLGTMAFRHGDHHSSLLDRGWEEVPVEEIAAFGPEAPGNGGDEGIRNIDEAIRALAAREGGHDATVRALGGDVAPPADADER